MLYKKEVYRKEVSGDVVFIVWIAVLVAVLVAAWI